MAMSASGFGAEDTPMSEINTTPLVDIMLVLLIIFLVTIPIAIQSIEKLRIPIFASLESKDKVENLLLSISTTDASGRSPGDPGYVGSSRYGKCRVYFNNTTLVNAEELREQAFKRLDAIVKRAGGPEALIANPEKIPQVHIRSDINAPWRCVAGVIYNVQISGYPTVGFISNPVDPKG
ncbi:MAG: biopolymer transporter ExbD [Sphingomonadaceae bacterium]|nr:biopolymer transporter ExbD [Sphingomonadaceae bacterium]